MSAHFTLISLKKKGLNLFANTMKRIISLNHPYPLPFQFNGKHYLQTQRIAMGTKMAVAFAVIFMAHIEKQLTHHKPFQTYPLETFYR